MKRVAAVSLILCICVALMLKFWVVELPQVTGQDMAPTIMRGDRLWVYRLDRKPVRGALVLLEHPSGPQLLIRRVVGLPGESVAVTRETPVVGGTPAQRAVVGDLELQDEGAGQAVHVKLRRVRETVGDTTYEVAKDPRRRSVDVKAVTLRGSYFVLADNRNHGTDSRTFGPVPEAKILGIVTRRVSAGAPSAPGEAPRAGCAPLSP
ncbi:MAG: signal peptidase I [Deltaproteobacteria bacterium]|nr:signal peptidase I [Deltaproteobacteria bacterium]